MTTATRKGPKDKYFRRSAAADVLGIELDGQSWKKLRPLIEAADADVQAAYEKQLAAFRANGVPRGTVIGHSANGEVKGTPVTEATPTATTETPKPARAKKPAQKRTTKARKPKSSKVDNASLASAMAQHAATAAGEIK